MLSEEITESLLGRLHRHELDAALLATAAGGRRTWTAMPLFDEPFWLAHPRNHPLYEQGRDHAAGPGRDRPAAARRGPLPDPPGAWRSATWRNGPSRGEMADLRAASLETLLQLVGAGFGCTLVPALAIRGGWMTDSGIVARRWTCPMPTGASRWSSAAAFPAARPWRPSPAVVRDHLPNTVRRLAKPGAPFTKATVTTPALGERPAPPG